MKRFLITALMLVAAHAWAATPTQLLARAIAKAEGFGAKGTIPTRYHNPGDIRASKGVRYPGQVGLNKHGYVIFRNDAAGWAALERQLDKVAAGESRFYSVNMTLKQFSRKYATSPTWIRNVGKNLGVAASTYLFEVLDVPPVVQFGPDARTLGFATLTN